MAKFITQVIAWLAVLTTLNLIATAALLHVPWPGDCKEVVGDVVKCVKEAADIEARRRLTQEHLNECAAMLRGRAEGSLSTEDE